MLLYYDPLHIQVDKIYASGCFFFFIVLVGKDGSSFKKKNNGLSFIQEGDFCISNAFITWQNYTLV